MLATSTKYAIKAVNYLVLAGRSDFIKVKDLSRKISAPSPYLSKVIKRLGVKGILVNRRGASGGVRLSDELDGMTLYDICVAMDDPIVQSTCMVSRSPCDSRHPCKFHKDWSRLRAEFVAFLRQSRFGT